MTYREGRVHPALLKPKKDMMENRPGRVQKLFLLSFISAVTGAASAEESGLAVTLDEVVVTATRSALAVSDAPAAVTVVNARDIQNKMPHAWAMSSIRCPACICAAGRSANRRALRERAACLCAGSIRAGCLFCSTASRYKIPGLEK